MKLNRKVTVIAVIMAILMGSSLFGGDKYTMVTGSKRGNYFKYGLRISTLVPGIKALPSTGSVASLDALLKNTAQIAIAQKDAYRWYTKKHPDAEATISEVGGLNKECVFIVASKTGKVDDDSDLQKDGIKIGIGKPGSGTMVTWQYMGELENGFKKATAVPVGGARALAKLTSGGLDAALFVQTPDMNSWLFRTVNGNDNLKFVDVTDWDLNDKLNGKPVYTFEKIETKEGFFGDSVKTICTQATLFVNNHVDDDTVDGLSDAILNHKNYILKGGK